MALYRQQVELDRPFRVDAQGRIAFTSDPARQLRNRVINVVATEIGERVMRPDYGTPLQSMLFEGDDDLTISIISTDIERALAEWEPGVVVRGVTAEADSELDGVINLNVTYSAVNSPLETVSIPVNTATISRGGLVEEQRSG